MACSLAGISTLILLPSAAFSQETLPDPQEMWRIIQQQQQQLEQQRQEIEALRQAQGSLAQEQAQTQETASQAQAAAESLLTTSTTGTGGWWDRTSIGGYGELHYEGGARDQIDFHRFVLFFGHEFTDDIRFFSELELEHALAGEGQPGEVELEQAYVQFDLNDQHQLNLGLQLIPAGILNLTHEPPTFFGVERNPVEANIIPTTWWEGGAGLSGNFGASGFSYDVLVSSGLQTPLTGGNAFRIRSGRQKVASARAKDPAYTGRLRYSGIPGVEWAVTAQYQSDVTQEAGDPATGEAVSATLITTHIDARREGFGLRALYASWWLDGTTPELLGRDWQHGFYVEPSYRFPLMGIGIFGGDLGFFYRYSWWDNNAGITISPTETAQHAVGVNYWPVPNVALKADYVWNNPESGADSAGLNLGIGYQF